MRQALWMGFCVCLVMVVVVAESGLARSLILEVETPLAGESIPDVEMVLNERLRGLTLSEIRDTITARLLDVRGHGRLIKIVIDSKDRIWREDHSEDLLFSGTDNLAAMPEFADRERLMAILKVVEEGRILSDFLGQVKNEGLVITIGREHAIGEIINCSLVTATYRVGDISGSVGIIGPTRLPYNKAVSIVQYTARSITDLLSGMDKEKD